MSPSPRYALYYTPDTDTLWWQAGCHWLGRDPGDNRTRHQPEIGGIPSPILHQLTSDARRYGFHATLKAPFRLAEGYGEEHLLDALHAFCRVQSTVEVETPTVQAMGDFLALRSTGDTRDINTLAMRCVSYFDFLRAAPSDAELSKRRRNQLSLRQEQLLQRWGYPFTEEEFRFHLTLTDSLSGADSNIAYSLRKAAEEFFALTTPMRINAVSLFKEDAPGADFSLMRRISFGNEQSALKLPNQGRIFFVVGPSGSGKDSLLAWVRQRLPSDRDLRFIQRTITRPAHTAEEHESISPEQFWQQAAEGHFAMTWQTHDLCYGIRRSFEADLKAGRDIVINGSREYVPQLLRTYPDAQVIWIAADDALLRKRLEERQREGGAALLKRVQRISQFSPPQQPAVVTLDNSGAIEVAGQRLLEIFSAN